MTDRQSDNQNHAFLKTIKEIRKDAGMTQSDLAQALNKPQSYVSKYESGERRLDFLEVCNICEKCNVSILDFCESYLSHDS